MPLKVDIFCQIIDNYGDIGITWRLAKQLSQRYQYAARLWIDDPASANKIIPQLNPELNSQIINEVEIRLWQGEQSNPSLWGMPAEVVIEAFACEVPQSYQALMPQHTRCWINLEYLSAEAWVEEFHLQSSLQAFNGLRKIFFFPGFGERTGGLIRENNLKEDSENSRHDSNFYTVFTEQSIHISLFSYPHAPIQALLEALANYRHPIICHTPLTSITQQLTDFFQQPIQAQQRYISGNLTLVTYPFLTQSDYDELLHRCDLNFVRGEDSLVRAIWAQKAFVWLPYLQSEQTHMDKLQAFLSCYWGNALSELQQVNQDWANGVVSAQRLHDVIDGLVTSNNIAKQRALQQAQQSDLVSRLNEAIQHALR